MPPIYIQDGKQDRPPAKDKNPEIKNSAATAVSSGDEKNRKKVAFFFPEDETSCHQEFSASRGNGEKRIFKKKRGSRRGTRYQSKSPPMVSTGGNEDRPPATLKTSKEKNSENAEKIAGHEKIGPSAEYSSNKQFRHGHSRQHIAAYERGEAVVGDASPTAGGAAASDLEPAPPSNAELYEIARQLDNCYYGFRPKWSSEGEEFSHSGHKKRKSAEVKFSDVSRVIEASKHVNHPLADKLRSQALADYSETTFRSEIYPDPPIRGCFGEAKILPKPGAQPHAQRPMRLCGERREALICEVKKWLHQHKISPAPPNTGWSSPAFVIPKKTKGTWRGLVDLRGVNDRIVTDTYVIPLIDEILTRQGRKHIWSVLDLKDAFSQVPVAPECRPITTCSTPIGQFVWNVVPQGLKKCPSNFPKINGLGTQPGS